MVARPLGIYIWFGIPMPLAQRLHAIRAAGFDAVSLWWDVKRGMGRDRLHALPAQVRDAGLLVENAHLPFAKCNALWSADAAARDAAVTRHLGWLDECAGAGIPLVVMHLTSGDDPPPPSADGLAGVARIVAEAGTRGIAVAVENVRKAAYLELALAEIPALRCCYDSSHARLWGPDDLLCRYGDRLAAVHLSDNDGRADRHWLPGDGVIDWPAVLRDFPRGYRGCWSLEVVASDAATEPGTLLEEAHRRLCRLAELDDGETTAMP